MKDKLLQWPVITGIQFVASVVLAFFVYRIGLLPFKYFAILCLVLLLLCALMAYMMKPVSRAKKGNLKSNISKVISLIISVVLVVGSVYVAKTQDALSDMAGADTKTHHYSLLVKKSSGYDSIKDLKNKSVEYSLVFDENNEFETVLKEYKKEQKKSKLKEVEEFEQLASDILDDKCDAILINIAYLGMLEDTYPDINLKLKEIWSFEIDTTLVDTSKDVEVDKTPFVVYISGIDTHGKISTTSRSDVNMIVTINPQTKQVLMTSIPRDYFVKLANKGKEDKLTHSGLAGPDNTVKTVENFMGIEINYYARVNFTSLLKMVDALGGIEVNIEKDYHSRANGRYYKKGLQTLDGEGALAYARERKAFGEGDSARAKHQQIVLQAMLNKMMSPSVITKYPEVLQAVRWSFETNMPFERITDLLKMQLNDNAKWTFYSRILVGTGTSMIGGAYMPNSKQYYMCPNKNSIAENRKAIKAVLAGEEPEEQKVLNGSKADLAPFQSLIAGAANMKNSEDTEEEDEELSEENTEESGNSGNNSQNNQSSQNNQNQNNSNNTQGNTGGQTNSGSSQTTPQEPVGGENNTGGETGESTDTQVQTQTE